MKQPFYYRFSPSQRVLAHRSPKIPANQHKTMTAFALRAGLQSNQHGR